jgi:hypothetical protein
MVCRRAPESFPGDAHGFKISWNEDAPVCIQDFLLYSVGEVKIEVQSEYLLLGV